MKPDDDDNEGSFFFFFFFFFFHKPLETSKLTWKYFFLFLLPLCLSGLGNQRESFHHCRQSGGGGGEFKSLGHAHLSFSNCH
jgi:hypothetical protein